MRVTNFDAGKVGFSHSRFASSAHSAWLSIFEYYFSLHVSPIYLSHAGYKKAVALLMGLYKREKFHMYSPALYRLKSRQPGAFLHPRADRSTSAMQNTLMERKTWAAAGAIFISSIKPFSLSISDREKCSGCARGWERKGEIIFKLSNLIFWSDAALFNCQNINLFQAHLVF